MDKSSNIIRLDEGGSSLPLWKVPDVESAVGTSAEDGIAKIVFQTSGNLNMVTCFVLKIQLQSENMNTNEELLNCISFLVTSNK